MRQRPVSPNYLILIMWQMVRLRLQASFQVAALVGLLLRRDIAS
jgi:hypothetical protein